MFSDGGTTSDQLRNILHRFDLEPVEFDPSWRLIEIDLDGDLDHLIVHSGLVYDGKAVAFVHSRSHKQAMARTDDSA